MAKVHEGVMVWGWGKWGSLIFGFFFFFEGRVFFFFISFIFWKNYIYHIYFNKSNIIGNIKIIIIIMYTYFIKLTILINWNTNFNKRKIFIIFKLEY